MKTQPKILLYAIIVLAWFAFTAPAAASDLGVGALSPVFSASEVISQINAYRQANGLAALQYNATLASLAQSHSQYMATTGTITHSEGGSTPTDRAYAAGYGDGNKIILSEIIFGGWEADVSDALTWWKNSAVHNGVMLDPQYLEIGAGVATAGSTTYFTAVIAWVTPYAASSGESPGGDSSGSGDDSGATGGFIYSPVLVATPMADGSVVHIVESGQTLWTIAAVYQVDLQTILDLNNMASGTWVFPGDRIIVQPPGSNPTPTPEDVQDDGDESPETAIGEAFSSGPVAYSTPLPTANPDFTQQALATPITALDVPEEPFLEDPVARWMIVIAFVVIFGVVVGSLFMQSPSKRPPSEKGR